MRFLYIGLIFFVTSSLSSQTLVPSVLDSLRAMDNTLESVQCSVLVKVDVPGLEMPDKNVFLDYVKGKKAKIKGDGLIFLPRKGMLGQMNAFLDEPYVPLLMKEDVDTVVYKLVSTDAKSDWVTMDIKIDKRYLKIHAMDVTTRKHGSYLIQHRYGSEVIPEKTEVSFEAIPLNLPTKFMGRAKGLPPVKDGDAPLRGRITLTYSDVQVQYSFVGSNNENL